MVPPDSATLRSFPRNQVVVIVSYVDPRVVPEDNRITYAQFSLTRNITLTRRIFPAEHPVIRVVGGRAKNALRSLLTLEHHLGLGAIVVVHHTDYGVSHASSAEFKATFRDRAATTEQVAEIDAIDFDVIHDRDVRASVESDVRYLKESPWFGNGLQVVGFVFDLKTGTVDQVQ
ncbi:hypothetical protein CONPUDRAFT_126323 [Coniophora puteana RWD-64-598 SS2]|uniref:Uncharacterized protein n=1 Tax=Coniophora puteana (strain RWD-64-598) TaxID=741705 RepID=A0A5M3MKV7_CONPW|nr:uncharacterized protein CONPUDRAFT_126323 [Coniophora puteana RWD-64-598 SS2]EIW79862.1 hypothetical protein CONPUDRAFT_126323 [Coniophora puteana RWD-64-598 SS2]